MTEPIKLWAFNDAPRELRDLSENGGDEDWVAEVPPSIAASFQDRELPYWISRLSNDTQRFNMDDGSIIIIGSHA